jgi:hypothetical protein
MLKEENNINNFLIKNESAFISQDIIEFFNNMIAKYKVEKSDVIQRADIDRSYGYQVLRGYRSASRDNYIRIAIGFGLDLEDTKRLLNVTQASPLYIKIKRDAAIIYCIEKHLDLSSTQELLYSLNLKILE